MPLLIAKFGELTRLTEIVLSAMATIPILPIHSAIEMPLRSLTLGLQPRAGPSIAGSGDIDGIHTQPGTNNAQIRI
jgi:hypothetical protein